MLRIFPPLPPQCRCSLDRPAMRLALSAPHRLSPLSLFPVRRHLHGSPVRFDSPGVFPESLQKTLDAHRASNRASLIRLVPSKPPRGTVHDSKGSSQDKTGSEPTQEQLSSKVAPIKESPRIRLVSSRDAAIRPQSAFSKTPRWVDQQLRWRANLKYDRPEQFPWLVHCLDHAKHNQHGAMAQLDTEIRALEMYMTPTQHEQSKVDQLATSVTKILDGIAPHSPQVTGSWQTGVASSHSDLDFVLPVEDTGRSMDSDRKPSPTRPQVLDTHYDLLRKVELTLRQSPMFNGQVHLSEKRTPTLTAIHHSTGLRLRFCCGEGLPSSIEYIKDYLAEYPAVRPLYRATRLILEPRGVFGPSRSSIGPTALLMLLVAFFKMNHGRFQRSGSLGDQLLAFLQTYGSHVDLRTTGVAVDPPGWFNAETTRDEYHRQLPEGIPAHLRGQRSLINLKRTAALKRNRPTAYHLCIQDPTNYMNDMGRSCTRTLALQKAWADAYESLKAALDAWDGSRPPIEQGSILSRGLRANFDDFEKKRAALAGAPDIIHQQS